MTSKGLKKDAEGLSKLNDEDIRNIEKGIPNYLFANKYSVGNRVLSKPYGNLMNISREPALPEVLLCSGLSMQKIAWQIITGNFWFGTGTGGYFPAYQKKYDEHPFF